MTRNPGVPEDVATRYTQMQDEVARLGTIIRNAYDALADGRRGDAMKMLKHAFPSERPNVSASPTGGSAA